MDCTPFLCRPYWTPPAGIATLRRRAPLCVSVYLPAHGGADAQGTHQDQASHGCLTPNLKAGPAHSPPSPIRPARTARWTDGPCAPQTRTAVGSTSRACLKASLLPSGQRSPEAVWGPRLRGGQLPLPAGAGGPPQARAGTGTPVSGASVSSTATISFPGGSVGTSGYREVTWKYRDWRVIQPGGWRPGVEAGRPRVLGCPSLIPGARPLLGTSVRIAERDTRRMWPGVIVAAISPHEQPGQLLNGAFCVF